MHPERHRLKVQLTRFHNSVVDDRLFEGLGRLVGRAGNNSFGIASAYWFKKNRYNLDSFSSLELDMFTYAKDVTFGTRHVTEHEGRKKRLEALFNMFTDLRRTYTLPSFDDLVNWIHNIV